MNNLSLYLILTVAGILAFNENGEIEAFAAFPKKVEDAAKCLAGILVKRKFELPKKFLDKIKGREVIVEGNHLAFLIEGIGNVMVDENNPEFRLLRGKIGDMLINMGEFSSVGDYISFKREVFLWLSRLLMKETIKVNDKIIIQAINTFDETSKTINLLGSRLREWYGLHFPELENLISGLVDYVSLVAKIGSRNNFDINTLISLGFNEGLAKRILEASQKSIGIDIDEEAIRSLAEQVLSLIEFRQKLEEYIAISMENFAPNLTAVAGPLIGARLISHAGGLEKLARLPSGTIQILGAEKALFKALKKGGKPPKHGVIFVHPEIRGAPRKLRGKIARIVAGKIAIAARIDCFGNRNIGEQLAKEMRERILEVKRSGSKAH